MALQPIPHNRTYNKSLPTNDPCRATTGRAFLMRTLAAGLMVKQPAYNRKRASSILARPNTYTPLTARPSHTTPATTKSVPRSERLEPPRLAARVKDVSAVKQSSDKGEQNT